jgi:hypothetical protein
MKEKRTSKQAAKSTRAVLSKSKVRSAPKVESRSDVQLSEFFRENGLPNVASLIEDLERTQAA